MAKCYFCDSEGSHEHHIIPKRLGPVENKTVRLCEPCHKKVHKVVDPTIEYLKDTESPHSKKVELSSRVREVELAIGRVIPDVLDEVMSSNGGSKRPALEELNRMLRESEGYDHDERGLVSPNTFYEWLDRHSSESV